MPDRYAFLLVYFPSFQTPEAGYANAHSGGSVMREYLLHLRVDRGMPVSMTGSSHNVRPPWRAPTIYETQNEAGHMAIPWGSSGLRLPFQTK